MKALAILSLIISGLSFLTVSTIGNVVHIQPLIFIIIYGYYIAFDITAIRFANLKINKIRAFSIVSIVLSTLFLLVFISLINQGGNNKFGEFETLVNTSIALPGILTSLLNLALAIVGTAVGVNKD